MVLQLVEARLTGTLDPTTVNATLKVTPCMVYQVINAVIILGKFSEMAGQPLRLPTKMCTTGEFAFAKPMKETGFLEDENDHADQEVAIC